MHFCPYWSSRELLKWRSCNDFCMWCVNGGWYSDILIYLQILTWGLRVFAVLSVFSKTKQHWDSWGKVWYSNCRVGVFSVWAELVPYSLLVMTLLLRGSPLDSATGQSCPALVCKTEFRQKFQLPHSNVVIEHVSGKPSRFQHHFPNHLDANAASATRAALAHCVPHSVNFIEIHLVSFSAGSQS